MPVGKQAARAMATLADFDLVESREALPPPWVIAVKFGCAVGKRAHVPPLCSCESRNTEPRTLRRKSWAPAFAGARHLTSHPSFCNDSSGEGAVNACRSGSPHPLCRAAHFGRRRR